MNLQNPLGNVRGTSGAGWVEVVEIVLIQCNLEENQYQQKSKVLHTFMPNKSYGYLLNVEPNNLVFL